MINDARANAPKRREIEREREPPDAVVVPFAFAEFFILHALCSSARFIEPSVCPSGVVSRLVFSQGQTNAMKYHHHHIAPYTKGVKETISLFVLFFFVLFSFGSRFSTGTGSFFRLYLLLDTWLGRKWLATICQTTMKSRLVHRCRRT